MMDEVREQIEHILWNVNNEVEDTDVGEPFFNELAIKSLSRQILALKSLAIVNRGAKVPRRRKSYKDALGDSYLQGQIDAQQDMLSQGWIKEVL